ncbi:hypothetical protein [Cytophaga hutchinsonii]|uniref:Uncharacterized protein n=1 Tax=Cytophaga hutchinsonii (strain ATCC 33406 / DSM 1761 / CIP 103989 / NBRC 15051 / NCIMB 9469 / D465) TaxID=269798 RepID=A0A6N4SVB8_CYTH3|nr:hypothetical protein [Cytophaga hutchinsonii]ABG60188.1 hypothetical protein CHU_2946 [Cytophaga hutchinsonii ATCC 33406]SFX22362.1 hypothetical protein SAMN04487930_102115 [Cytophaga hutchinsonii ATCC 33406]
MIVNVSKFKIAQGAFADVFIDLHSRTAFKLFKSYKHPDLNGTGKEEIGETKTNAYRRKVFDTEIKAYNSIQASSLLKQFTPKYHGTLKVKVLDNCGKDISFQYLRRCCYKMDFIEGENEKIDLLDDKIIKILEKKIGFNLDVIKEAFIDMAVIYTSDSSVIYNENEFKIIDFATLDFSKFEPSKNSLGENPYDNLNI